MWRGIFTGFFVFILIFQSLDRFGMIAFYELNKEMITEMFCVNKSRPSMGCEGKCFLTKQLKEMDEKEDKLPGKLMETKEIHLFPIQDIARLKPDSILKVKIPDDLNFFFKGSFISEVFHPPRSLSFSLI